MCQHSSHYSIHDNLVNWGATYVIATILNWMSRQPETNNDYTLIWVSGAAFGFLLMWALEIGREWMKTWRAS